MKNMSKKEIQDLYAQYNNATQMAKELNINVKTVYRNLKNMASKRRQVLKELENTILTMIISKISIQKKKHIG